MYNYIRLLGCKISSFFNYIVEKLTPKRKKYKNDDNDISYDDIYVHHRDIENVFLMSLVQE